MVLRRRRLRLGLIIIGLLYSFCLFLLNTKSYAAWGNPLEPISTQLNETVHSNTNKIKLEDYSHCIKQDSSWLYLGLRWECVELIQRYYYNKFGYLRPTPEGQCGVGNALSARWGVHAFQIFNAVKNKDAGLLGGGSEGLSAKHNSDIKDINVPVKGDIIVFDLRNSNDLYGHVALVNNVDGNTITIAEQNASLDGFDNLKIKNGKIVTRAGNGSVLGWIRSSRNPYAPKPNEMILSQDRTMQVRIISYSSECAGDLKQLNLGSNTDKMLIENYQNNIGKTVDLGTFAQGSEIALVIDTGKSSCNKYRPSTHTDFAKVTNLGTDHWKIEWEDQDSDGNGDFDDLVVEIFPVPPQQNENYIVSDTQTLWNNNGKWENAVEAWVNPAWTSLAGTTWIWKSYKVTTEEAANGVTVEFKRLFNLPADTSGKITVYADNGVEVFLNGAQITKLLCMERGSSSIRQECAVSYPLQGKSGINELRFVAYSYDTPGSTPENNSAGLAFKVEF